MKLAFRSLLAMALGITVAFLMPTGQLWFTNIVDSGSYITLQLGKYLTLPFLFFNLVIAVALLTRQKKFFKITIRVITAILGLAIVVAITGTLIALIVPIQRIPISFEQDVSLSFVPSVKLMEIIIPSNSFVVFGEGLFFALFALALVLGRNLTFDREVCEPAFNVIDSLGRVFYHIAHTYVFYSFIPIFFFAAKAFYRIRSANDIDNYFGILIVVITSTVILAIVLYSFIYSLFIRERGMGLRWMRGVYAFPLFAIFSENSLVSVMHYSYLSHYNQGIRRELIAYVVSILAIFGRVGIVFVNSIALIVIIKSYNSLDITVLQIVQAILYNIASLFMIPLHFSDGLETALNTACILYGHNINSGAIMLAPIMPILNYVASFFDALTLVIIVRVLAYTMKFEKFRMRTKFI